MTMLQSSLSFGLSVVFPLPLICSHLHELVCFRFDLPSPQLSKKNEGYRFATCLVF